METIYSCNSVNNTLIEIIASGKGKWAVMESGSLVKIHADYMDAIEHARSLVYTERPAIQIETIDMINAKRIAEAQATLAFIEDVKSHFNGDVMHIRWWERNGGVYGYGGQSLGRMF